MAHHRRRLRRVWHSKPAPYKPSPPLIYIGESNRDLIDLMYDLKTRPVMGLWRVSTQIMRDSSVINPKRPKKWKERVRIGWYKKDRRTMTQKMMDDAQWDADKWLRDTKSKGNK